MSSFSTVHQIAHQNLPNVMRAVTQIKWAMAYADELALKAAMINAKVETNSLISNACIFLRDVYTYSVNNEPIRKMIDTIKERSHKDIEAKLATFKATNGKNLVTPREQLRMASLADKRTIMRSIPLVSVPVAAAYLGVATRALNDFISEFIGVIGGRYAGGYCLSIDEIFLIEQSSQCLAGANSSKKPFDRDQTNDGVFAPLLFVSTDVACAYTDTQTSELRKIAPQSAQSRRPYRLSDLEKIRTGKLNAQRV